MGRESGISKKNNFKFLFADYIKRKIRFILVPSENPVILKHFAC